MSPLQAVTQTPAFDVDRLLGSGAAGAAAAYRPRDVIYLQGDPCVSVMYLRAGLVKLSVLSASGKEAIIAVLEPGAFFGENALTGAPHRRESATALTAVEALRIPKDRMMRLVHDEPAFAGRFIAYLLARNSRAEEDIVDHLLNSGEKRLARTLLLLARNRQPGTTRRVLPPMSQQTLADIVGTTRSRINFFLKTFRKRGYIEYRDGLTINDSLATVVLRGERVATRRRKTG